MNKTTKYTLILLLAGLVLGYIIGGILYVPQECNDTINAGSQCASNQLIYSWIGAIIGAIVGGFIGWLISKKK